MSYYTRDFPSQPSSLSATVPVRELPPQRRAEHHAHKDDGGEEGLVVLAEAPRAVQGRRQDAQDHHLHRVRHPAQTRQKAAQR